MPPNVHIYGFSSSMPPLVEDYLNLSEAIKNPGKYSSQDQLRMVDKILGERYQLNEESVRYLEGLRNRIANNN